MDISYSKTSNNIKYSSLFLLLGLYINFTTKESRVRGLVIASCFSIIESITYYVTDRGLFTTIDQFFANLIYCSIILDAWQMKNINSILRVILAPITIWILEIIQNYVLIFIFSRNTAWSYTNLPFNLFHGAIDLEMINLWWLLGILLEIAYPYILVPLSSIISPYIDYIVVFLLIIFLLCNYIDIQLPRFPPSVNKFPKAQKKIKGITILDWSEDLPILKSFNLKDKIITINDKNINIESKNILKN